MILCISISLSNILAFADLCIKHDINADFM